jgi:ABC-2 type transport system permease protein
MGASFVAIGLLASSLTENQVIAVALSFCALLLFWLIGWSASHAGPTLAKVLSYLSITQHLQDFQRGVVDTKDVVFYASLILVGLFLTVTVIESRRWRR